MFNQNLATISMDSAIQRNFHTTLINTVKTTKVNDGTIKPENSISNCVFILENEPYLKDSLRFNELSNTIEIIKPFPWNKEPKPFSDTDETHLRKYFEKYNMKNIKGHLNDAIRLVADRNKYHPIKEYFDTLKWDGTPRIGTLLHKLFDTDDNIYHSEVLTVFMIGAVSRIYNPGCKFDYMPIISAKQGIGKSTFFKTLAVKPEWYLEDLRSVDKAGIEQIQGKWIVEWGELNAMSRAKDVSAIKIFVTTTNDTLRLPYDKYVSNFKRQCVFSGTTNENQFLYDKTGNRRFLPIKSNIPHGKMIDVDYLSSVLDQLWAEALELYRSGYKPILTPEAGEIAFGLQSDAMDEDINLGLINAFLNREGWGDKQAPTEVCTLMLWVEALNCKREMRRYDSKEIARIMDNMEGWTLYSGSKDGRKRVGSYGNQRCWVRSE